MQEGRDAITQLLTTAKRQHGVTPLLCASANEAGDVIVPAASNTIWRPDKQPQTAKVFDRPVIYAYAPEPLDKPVFWAIAQAKRKSLVGSTGHTTIPDAKGKPKTYFMAERPLGLRDLSGYVQTVDEAAFELVDPTEESFSGCYVYAGQSPLPVLGQQRVWAKDLRSPVIEVPATIQQHRLFVDTHKVRESDGRLHISYTDGREQLSLRLYRMYN